MRASDWYWIGGTAAAGGALLVLSALLLTGRNRDSKVEECRARALRSPVLEIELSDLGGELRRNSIVFNERYECRLVKTRGTVTSISSLGNEEATVTLGGAFVPAPAVATMSRSAATKLTTQSEASVTCMVERSSTAIVLTHCAASPSKP
jgi:hypothetical protein